MSGKTIVIQPGTTLTASPKRLLVFMVSVLAVTAAIVWGSMASNEAAAVSGEVDRRVDYALRHPDETFLVPATPLEQTSDDLATSVPVSARAELHRSSDYGVRHLADWNQLEFMTSVD